MEDQRSNAVVAERSKVAETVIHYPWNQFKRFCIFFVLMASFLFLTAWVYRSIFLALSVSLVLAYIFNPTVHWLRNQTKTSRPLLILVLMVFFFGLLLLSGALLLPILYEELVIILKKVPFAITYLRDLMEPLRTWLSQRGFGNDELINRIIGDLTLTNDFSQTTTNALRQLWTTTPLVLGGALNLLLVPIFTWFFLNYSDRIFNFVINLIPQDLQAVVQLNVGKINKILWGVMKGQVLVALILSCLYMIGFSIISLQSGLAIGAIAGLCRVVPYVDVVVGAFLSLVVITSQGGTIGMVLAVAIVIALVQAIDGMFITPRIIGERAGIHPVIVIASVIAFGDWFGIFGILMAVPCVAILSASLQMALPYYRNSPFYRDGP